MQSPGDRAPGVTIDGTDLGTGPAVVAFFTQDCAASRLLVPFLPRLTGLVTVRAVSQDDPQSTEEYSSRAAPGIEVLVDSPAFEASRAFGFEGVPAVFLIDADGTVADSFVGWDRERFNEIARRAAALTGRPEQNPVAPDEAPAMRPG